MFVLDHVAVLTDSLEREIVDHSEWTPGPIETFEAEGTREVYLGNDGRPKLLFLQAIGDGPYRNAEQKRGCGLHHVCFKTADIEKGLNALNGSGWRMHRCSITTFRTSKTVWLIHSDAKFLVELHAADAREVSGVQFIAPASERAATPLGLTAGSSLELRVGENLFSLP